MATQSLEVLLSWRGRTAYDREGEKLGKLGELYLDDGDVPAYASVHTGLFGRHESLVPLAGVQERDGDLVVPYDAALVRDAPKLDPDATLDPEEEHALMQHYGTQKDRDYGTEDPNAMVRSEEEISVTQGEMVPAERVRLRKVNVTEHVPTVVQRRKEVIQLETEPPPPGTIESVEDLGEDSRHRS